MLLPLAKPDWLVAMDIPQLSVLSQVSRLPYLFTAQPGNPVVLTGGVINLHGQPRDVFSRLKHLTLLDKGAVSWCGAVSSGFD